MAPQELTYDLPFGAAKAAVQFVETAEAVTFTDTGDLVGLTAHGFSAGDLVVFPTIVTTTGITAYTPYYVIASGLTADAFKVATSAGGSAVTLTTDGTGTITRFREVRLRMANKITSNSDVKTVNYEGDNTIIKRTNTQSIGFTFDMDALPIGAHAAIYGITPVSSNLPDGYTNSYGLFGTSGEITGKAVGFWIEASDTQTDANGVASTKTVRYWYPQGTLTASKPPELTTSDKPGAWQYTFNVTDMSPTVDIAGVALPNPGKPLQILYK